VSRYDAGSKDSRTKYGCKKCNDHVDDGWGNRWPAGGGENGKRDERIRKINTEMKKSTLFKARIRKRKREREREREREKEYLWESYNKIGEPVET